MARLLLMAVLAVLFLSLSSCAAVRSLAAVSQVRFSLDYVHSVELAGVELDRVRRYEDLGLTDVFRIASAAAERSIPLALTLELTAQNPEDNPEARLVGFDWTLLLGDRRTVEGSLDRDVRIPSGGATGFPLNVSLDLVEFFEEGGRDLVDAVLALVGEDGAPVGIRLEVEPRVETPLGPVRYPAPITLGGRG